MLIFSFRVLLPEIQVKFPEHSEKGPLTRCESSRDFPWWERIGNREPGVARAFFDFQGAIINNRRRKNASGQQSQQNMWRSIWNKHCELSGLFLIVPFISFNIADSTDLSHSRLFFLNLLFYFIFEDSKTHLIGGATYMIKLNTSLSYTAHIIHH